MSLQKDTIDVSVSRLQTRIWLEISSDGSNISRVHEIDCNRESIFWKAQSRTEACYGNQAVIVLPRGARFAGHKLGYLSIVLQDFPSDQR